MTAKQQLGLYMLLPLAISLAGAILCFWPLFVIGALAIFLLTGKLPLCAGRESLWLFLTSFLDLIPVNSFLIWLLASSWWAHGIVDTWFDGALWLVLIYLTLLSVEEIILLLLSRITWPNQDDDKTLQELIEDSRHKGGKNR